MNEKSFQTNEHLQKITTNIFLLVVKKLLLILVSIFLLNAVATHSYGQVAKGQWLLGGSGYIDPDKFFSISLRPTAAYMVHNRIAVGAMMDLSYTNQEQLHYISGYLIPTIRYYFGKSRTQPFLMAGFGVANGTLLGKTNLIENNTEFSFYGGAGIGLSHQLNQNIALELIAGRSNSSITVYRGTFVTFGFQIFLNKRNLVEESK